MIVSTIELRGTLRVSDLIRFQYFNILRLLWPLLLLGVPFVPLNILMFFLGDDWRPIATNALPFSGLILFWLLLPPVSARWQLSKRPYLSEEMRYCFDIEGARLTAPSFSTFMKWPAIHAVRETKSAFLVYSAPNVAQLVPKTLFPTEADVIAWREAVGTWITPKSIRSPGLLGRLC